MFQAFVLPVFVTHTKLQQFCMHTSDTAEEKLHIQEINSLLPMGRLSPGEQGDDM